MDLQSVSHYYGDIVRKLFLLAGIIMLVTLPFFNNLLPVSLYTSLLAIVIVGFFAGLTNPIKKWIAIFNVIVATGGFVAFEYYAVDFYVRLTKFSLFLTDQILAIIFFVALYYSIKTLRGMAF